MQQPHSYTLCTGTSGEIAILAIVFIVRSDCLNFIPFCPGAEIWAISVYWVCGMKLVLNDDISILVYVFPS